MTTTIGVIYRCLEGYWDSLRELLFNMSSNGLTFDFIGFSGIFQIQHVLQYTINDYHNLLFNTILDSKMIYSSHNIANKNNVYDSYSYRPFAFQPYSY